MSSFVVGALFAGCFFSLLANKLDKHTTLKMSEELAERRLKAGAAPTTV
jgi:hypothetical protein